MLTPTTAEAWRKASPDPSESSTKPYRFPGLNHFSLPQTVGAGGSPSCVSASCGGTSGWLKGALLSPSPGWTSECLAGSPLSPSPCGTSECPEGSMLSPSRCGAPECPEGSLLSPSLCGAPEYPEGSLLSPSRCGTSECPAGSPLSPSSMTCCRRRRTSLRRSTTNLVIVLSMRASGIDSRYSVSGGQSRLGRAARITCDKLPEPHRRSSRT